MVDLAALAEALREGHVAGAAVDVYPTEPEKNRDGFTTGGVPFLASYWITYYYYNLETCWELPEALWSYGQSITAHFYLILGSLG